MKKIASLTGALLVLMAGASFAAGINLAWDNCLGQSGTQDKTVPCATTTTTQQLVGSFVLASQLNVTSTTNTVDAVNASTPGAFWTLSGSGLGTRFTFDAGPAGCPTWTNGQALDNVNGRSQTGNRMQLRVNLVIGDVGADVMTLERRGARGTGDERGTGEKRRDGTHRSKPRQGMARPTDCVQR